MTTPLQRYRLRKKWSCADMAARITACAYTKDEIAIGCAASRSLVSKWERGLVQPSLEYALAIQRLCGRSVPLSSLLVRR